uniref:Uncharacterized protein n=1 Tax=Rhizophora mucronata TaxID=61149 RepID=A0A2P2PMY3_RHIMU
MARINVNGSSKIEKFLKHQGSIEFNMVTK